MSSLEKLERFARSIGKPIMLVFHPGGNPEHSWYCHLQGCWPVYHDGTVSNNWQSARAKTPEAAMDAYLAMIAGKNLASKVGFDGSLYAVSKLIPVPTDITD